MNLLYRDFEHVIQIKDAIENIQDLKGNVDLGCFLLFDPSLTSVWSMFTCKA